MNPVKQHLQLTEKIIGCAMKGHSALGPGFLESVYQNALTHELQKAGLFVECGNRIQVQYDDVIVGDFIADMRVERFGLIENKAVQMLSTRHEVQLVNYLTATGLDIGLLLNFGTPRLEFKRKTRAYHSPNFFPFSENDANSVEQGAHDAHLHHQDAR